MVEVAATDAEKDEVVYLDRGKWVTDHLGPINAIMFSATGILIPIVDFFSPNFPFKQLAAIVVLGFLLLVVMKVLKIPKRLQIPNGLVLMALFCTALVSASAFATYKKEKEGGFLASSIPALATLQRSMQGIKGDTEKLLASNDSIEKKTSSIDQKMDRNNFLLTQVLASVTAPLEKQLKEEIKSYDKLAKNQKDALVYLSSKLGVNGVKKYKRLMSSVEAYANKPSEKNGKAVVEYMRYIVEVNGKRIEDEKTRLFVLALFFEPETFDYLLGNSQLPQMNSPLLKLFNIDPSRPAVSQIKDPLGDFTGQLRATGQEIKEYVFIPKEQQQPAPRSSTPKGNGAVFFGI